MKCDRCESEATVHEVTIKSGRRHEKHLCERCAREQKIPIASNTPLTDLLTQYVSLQAAAKEAKGQAIAATSDMCPACGMTFASFRQSEKLGCMHCYSTFEGQLSKLLERLHDGATHHVGKTPRRLAACAATPGEERAGQKPPRVVVLTAAQLQRRVGNLKKKLDEAVTLEQYEKAAQIRDELLKLQKLSAPSLPGWSTQEGEGSGL
ncbi:MAG TPA: UvrB/UvrC motif-containing protein [Phycisphaerales bacterium]|nr:UvrB/UvrC motif-containing protein [Phycisphaerales bacterium]